MAVVVKIAYQWYVTAQRIQALAYGGDLRCRFRRINRNAHHFAACLPQLKHLRYGRLRVRGVGIGHALHHNRAG